MNVFHRKTPKSQQSDKTPYTLYYPYAQPIGSHWENRIRVLCIVPSIQNYCIRVEERPFVEKVDDKTIKTLLYDKLVLKKTDIELTENNEFLLYKLLSDYLDLNLELFKTCHIVIIPRQVSEYYKATRIVQHSITYFLLHLQGRPQLPIILEVDHKLKGKELGADTNLNKHGLKKWTQLEAHALLTKRQDTVALEILDKNKKKDDLSDTVCQIEAVFKYMGWPTTTEIKRVKLVLRTPDQI